MKRISHVEYYGTNNSKYNIPTSLETIYTYNNEVFIGDITKVHGKIEEVKRGEYRELDNLKLILVKVTLNIEYISSLKDEVLNILTNDIYTTINYLASDSQNEEVKKPIIGDIYVRPMDLNSIYISLNLYPY